MQFPLLVPAAIQFTCSNALRLKASNLDTTWRLCCCGCSGCIKSSRNWPSFSPDGMDQKPEMGSFDCWWDTMLKLFNIINMCVYTCVCVYTNIYIYIYIYYLLIYILFIQWNFLSMHVTPPTLIPQVWRIVQSILAEQPIKNPMGVDSWISDSLARACPETSSSSSAIAWPWQEDRTSKYTITINHI